MKKPEYVIETKSTKAQNVGKEKLLELFSKSPLPREHLLVNLGLYMRSSLLAKTLFLNELYQKILPIPGVIIEFGIWWGQNMVLFENLRAIYEPFNQTRKIIGFDTFSGYKNFSEKDVQNIEYDFNFGEAVVEGGYSVSEGYQEYLDSLLEAQQNCNILGHIKKHLLVSGDVTQTVPDFFNKNESTVVALAYFDLALYKPTKTCLEAIKAHLIPGSVVLLDEFNFPEAPGETVAFFEAFHDVKYKIEKSSILPDKTLVIIST